MYIAHRINSSEQANSIPVEYGIEFDLRDSNNKIIVTHDPFTQGEEFEEFLSKLSNRFLIVNIKSEGIEIGVLELLKKYKFEDFFLLDCSFPSIVKLSKLGEKRIALRFSEYENFVNVIDNKDKISWVWVDCFSEFPLTKHLEEVFHIHGLKICVVSPELQGQSELIHIYKDYIKQENINIDAICTKSYNISLWNNT
jgi:hypothetical protein